MDKCPFINPNFDLDFDLPCPVCGAYGYTDPDEISKMCVDQEEDVNAHT